MKTNKKIVYFTGTLPKKGETPFGGGEVGNLRTIRMLKSFGYDVNVVRRRRSDVNESMRMKRIIYPFRMLANAIEWFFVLLFGTRKNGVVHVSGFYGKTIYVEILQVFIAKAMGYKLIYELRGGGAAGFYEKGDKKYRKQFKSILNKADYLLSQGKENEPLIHSLCDTPVYYYPNCVQQGFYPEVLADKPNNQVNLLFFGRIEYDKNPMLIVKVADLLQQEFDNITLTMLGNGQADLIAKVGKQMQQTLRPESYQLLPGCAHDELQKMFPDKHFYIFPSQQKREGQSNAVTEAMSYGIIPVASPQGFNRSTIGDSKLIVDELTAKAYAERIAMIIRNGEIEKYSRFVRQRFMENYTEEAVFAQAKKYYEVIFKS